MKKIWAFVLTLAALLSVAGCGVEESQPTPEPTPSATAEPTPTPILTPTPTPTPTPPPTAEDIFPREFWFSSGSGGWGTGLEIGEDGSFSGHYQDVDLGGDPPDTRFCNFTGRFSWPEKVNEYTYSVKLEEFQKEDDKEELDEYGMLWVPADAYGLEGGDEFLIYLPGAPVEKLPEPFVMWTAHGYYGSWNGDTLPDYGLYNVAQEQGFFSY